MLADLTCDPSLLFDNVCRAISGHDPTHVAGPVTERIIDSIGLFLVVYLIGRIVRRVSDAAAKRGIFDEQKTGWAQTETEGMPARENVGRRKRQLGPEVSNGASKSPSISMSPG